MKNVLVNVRVPRVRVRAGKRATVAGKEIAGVTRTDKFASDVTHSTHEHGLPPRNNNLRLKPMSM